MSDWREPDELYSAWRVKYLIALPDDFVITHHDVEMLYPNEEPDMPIRYAHFWWQRVWTPHMSNRASLIRVEVQSLTGTGEVQSHNGGSNDKGWIDAPACPSSRSGTIAFHSGDKDNWALKRMAVPGLPSYCESGGVLTKAGESTLLTLARSLYWGHSMRHWGGVSSLLIWNPGGPPGKWFKRTSPGFRYVNHIRVFTYTSRAKPMLEA